jgi:DNA replication protein DnaC
VRRDVPVGHADFGKLHRCPQHTTAHDVTRRETLRRLGNLEAFAGKSLDDFSIDPTLSPRQRASLENALAQARAFAAHPQGWLLFEGGYGTGKTHLAAAIANARLEQGDPVLFITTPDLLDHLRSTFGPSSEIAYDETFERIRSAPLLVLDDLGVENPSAWAKEKLFQLLNHRYVYRLPTIITTNIPTEQLDPRVRSRLLDDDLLRHAAIEAPDHRTPHLHQQETISDLALYAAMTFETFDTETHLNFDQKNNLRAARAVAEEYVANGARGWLVFMGAAGVGKTHLAAAIGGAVEQAGAAVTFSTVPELMDSLRETFEPNSTASFNRRFTAIKTAPLLILDDLTLRYASGWAREKLFQIIDHRYVTRLPLVITTALSIEELDDRLRARLMDKRICRNVVLTAPAFTERAFRR